MENISIDNLHKILSQTLEQFASREISVKRVNTILKIASAISKNIHNRELNERLLELEVVIKKRK